MGGADSGRPAQARNGVVHIPHDRAIGDWPYRIQSEVRWHTGGRLFEEYQYVGV
jgi:hypothetical protein